MRILLVIAALLWAVQVNAIEIDPDANDAVDVANGGTNGTTAAEARVNLGFPTCTTDDQIYQWNNTIGEWECVTPLEVSGGGYVAAPTHSDESCTVGQWSFDASYHYICEATDTWDRYAVTFAGWDNPQETTSYLVNQNFEGTGYDNSETWTEVGSPDEDYTTTVLRGSQSLYFQGGGNVEYTTSPTFAASSTVWTHFMLRSSDWTPTDGYNILELRNSTTILARLIYLNTGLSRIFHGSSEANGPTLVDNTTYHVWIKYVAGTGADGEMELYVSETTTRGSAVATISTGTSTASVDNLIFKSRYTDIVIDQILVDDAEVANVD